MVGDFNLLFHSNDARGAQGGTCTLTKNSLAKLTELKKTYELCDAWRERNRKPKRFTFTEKHSSIFVQHRLDYIFILNTLQTTATTEILTPISKYHS